MWYKPKKVKKKMALNSQLMTLQILTNDVQVLFLCPFYLITTVHLFHSWLFNGSYQAYSVCCSDQLSHKLV